LPFFKNYKIMKSSYLNSSKKRIIFDITTSRSWGSRPPVGVIRAEKELGAYLLNQYKDKEITFCYFDDEKNIFFEISNEEAKNFIKKSQKQVINPEIQNTQNKTNDLILKYLRKIQSYIFNFSINHKSIHIFLHLTKSYLKGIFGLLKILINVNFSNKNKTQPEDNLYKDEVKFCKEDTYISLGLDWDHKKKIIEIYNLKKKIKFKVILFCYDLVAIKYPQFVPTGFTALFTHYLIDALWCADKMICISQKTKNDLVEFINEMDTPKPILKVIHFGSDFKKEKDYKCPTLTPQLKQGNFVLYVSTIEARKNHQLLYQLWLKFHEEGLKNIPYLVFVGMHGWLIDNLLYAISKDRYVKDKIIILNNLPDDNLSWLYANCLFTLFPSFYEGWGIPVAESLSYGKTCICSNRGSLPEVGLDYCIYIDPFDSMKWYDIIKGLIVNKNKLIPLENKIKNNYKIFRWFDTGKQFLNYINKND
jgi:glycosyltransferase involved in cell wall biosynthesis